MCYPKLKFAIWLAELVRSVCSLVYPAGFNEFRVTVQGMVEEAARYAAEARDVVRACKRAGKPTKLYNIYTVCTVYMRSVVLYCIFFLHIIFLYSMYSATRSEAAA